MAHGFRRQPLTAEAFINRRIVHLEFSVDIIAQGQVVLRVLWFLLLLSFHTCSTLIHSSTTDAL